MNEADSISPWAQSWYRLKQHRMAMLGLILLSIIGLLCLIAPWLTSYTYREQNIDLGAIPPCAEHWLGTDTLGRDLFTRILYGGRISFMVGLIATAVSLLIGVPYGALSGYLGGRTDRFMMRVVEIIYSLPYTIFVILLMVVVGRGLLPLLLAIGAVEWLAMARLVRGQVLAVKEQEFVQAAHVLGQSNFKILSKHIIPNVLGTVIVCATLTVPSVMLLESFLSFLGLGIQAPMTSWGDLIKDGVVTLEEYPWMLIFPSIFFSVTLFSLNFLGDGLRDALDPRVEAAR
tara:strand:+ start:5960 stop:6823 length:864 start_codon:yes stop_codon:yes gene_type:complete